LKIILQDVLSKLGVKLQYRQKKTYAPLDCRRGICRCRIRDQLCCRLVGDLYSALVSCVAFLSDSALVACVAFLADSALVAIVAFVADSALVAFVAFLADSALVAFVVRLPSRAFVPCI